MLPNFIVIGAEKSATTTLCNHLKAHSDIFMPDTKEIHFFNQYDSNLVENKVYVQRGVKWYEKFFENYSGEKAVGEGTPMYLCDEKAPERIFKTLPDIKLIAILRNPVDRAYSHYWMAKGKGDVIGSFEDIVNDENEKIIKRGLYAGQLQRYYQFFDKKQIIVILYEDYIEHTDVVLGKVLRFMDLDDEDLSFVKNEIYNKSGQVRSITILRLSRAISNFFRKKINLGIVVDCIKKVGLSNFIKNWNKKEKDYPKLQENVRQKLIKYYEHDVLLMSELLNNDSVKEWLK